MPNPRRDTSLLERAAQVYDFAQFARAPRVEAPTPARVPPSPLVEDEDEPLELSPTLLAIPEHLRAAAGADPDELVLPDDAGDEVRIDRGLLAERGMIVPGAPAGPLAEEFRLIKRQLFVTRSRLAEAGEADKARTALVCSARPGDGKTFSTINLALSIAAERDTEVLLVDADVMKPDVPRQLGLEDGPGLLDALADSHVDVEQLVLRTDVPHLSVLRAGTRSTTDTELLSSARTRAVLHRLLDANPRRMILLDSPPALAASPAAVLAMLVGQVLLVVRADRTPESELSAAVGLLDGCAHIGLILNAVSFTPSGQRFGYYGQESHA